MTGQLGRIGDLLISAENKHDNTASKKNKPFGPTWDKVLVSFRDPPPNQFRLPENTKTQMLLIAAGSGIGTGFSTRNVKEEILFFSFKKVFSNFF